MGLFLCCIRGNTKMISKWYLVSLFCLTGAIAETELYCKNHGGLPDDWSICRTCTDVSKKCDNAPSGCYCENIEVKNPRTDKLRGNSSCTDVGVMLVKILSALMH